MQVRYEINIKNFSKLPSTPIAYWLSEVFFELLAGENIKSICNPCIGMRTGDNERFLRLWYEVEKGKASYGNLSNYKDKKWIPYNKGGGFRRWYGLNEYLVNWDNNGQEIKENTRLKYGDNISWKISNEKYYFREGITWGSVTSAITTFRYYPEGYIFSNCGQSVVMNEDQHSNLYAMEAYLNSNVVIKLLKILSPTVGCESGYVAKLPYNEKIFEENKIKRISMECVNAAKEDWDSFETSWDFKKHPLI